MESAPNPGGSDDRENDENKDKKLKTEETKEKKESEISLKRNLSSSRKKNTENLPTVFSYQSSKKHAFKDDDKDKDKDKNKKKPSAPSRYYTSQVNAEQHQPRYLLTGKEDEKTRNSPSNSSTEQRTSRDTTGENILRPNFNVDFWAAYPRSIPSNVSSSLALLHDLDTIVIQQMDFIQLAIDMDDTPNLYLVQNANGQCLYYAYETTSLFGQFCMRGERTLQVHIMDFYNNEVIYISKTCGSGALFCCYPVVEVYSPPLQPVGAIFRRPNLLRGHFEVVDVSEKKIFNIRAPPCCWYGYTNNIVEFTIYTADRNNTQVGVITREIPLSIIRTGVYGLNFPSDLDVKMKAVLLGAIFFIDCIY